jgi:uncharacterized protein (DUF58 family)
LKTLLALLAVLVPLGGLTLWRIYPHRPLVMFALVPGLLSIGLIARPNLFWPLLALDALLALVALIDLTSLPKHAAFFVEREAGRIASLKKPHRVVLTISNRSSRAYTVWIRDSIGGELSADPPQLATQLTPRSRATLHYELLARRRGAFTLDAVYIRTRSRWGLWQRYAKYPVETLLHVYPDMQQLSEYAVLARTNRLSLMGVRRVRRIGQDNEFERLRDYTLDDNFKHIDWRSTARRGKLTVKDFQANQSQRLIFLIDCGRMMTNTAAGLSLLDHSLNAMLMLSFVALRQGDSVGLLSFSDEIHGFVPPRGGMNQMNHLLHASFDRFPRLVESRYDEAFLYLAAHCRKRSLVVLITNVIDEVNSLQIERYLASLVGRHLPLGVLLRDHRLFDAADNLATNNAALYRAAAAAEILLWRRQVLHDLTSKGVLALDVFPEQMTAPLVNQYLDAKARHLL